MNKTPVSRSISQIIAPSAHSQHGYTLIELMVALALGLLISAAAIQLFITSQTTFSLQQGGADIQDSSIFGLELISRNARMANHGGGRPVINDFTPLGGIVFTADPTATETTITNAPTVNLQSVQLDNAAVPLGLLTRGQGLTVGATANHWTGVSNASVVGTGAAQSAQLVIQYRAPQDMFDCEGQRALGPRMANQADDDWGGVFDADGDPMVDRMIDGDVVVERYFLRKDTTGVATGENADQALVLACDAGRYSVNNQEDVIAGTIPINGFGGAGQVLMSRVDHFDIRLGVEVAGGTRYYTIKEYLDNRPAPAASGAAVARPRVISLQVAVLVRAQGKSGSASLDPNQVYAMLGQDVKIAVPDSTVKAGYLRKVYETTVALRNGRGE